MGRSSTRAVRTLFESVSSVFATDPLVAFCRVFIGETISTIGPLLTAELDSALLNEKEWKAWEKIMKNPKTSMKRKTEKLEELFEDGWEDWIDEEDHSEHDH